MEQTNKMKERPLGQFRIPFKVLAKNWRMVKAIMQDVVVLDARSDFSHDCIVYTAYCDQFDEVRQGELEPRYNPLMFTLNDGTSYLIKWDKLDE